MPIARVCLVFLLLFPLLVRAEPPADSAIVERVLNGKTFLLQGGEKVRLASLQVPNIAETTGKRRPGQPMGEEAAAALRRLAEGKSLTLSPTPAQRDRHGRRVAFATLPDGRSLQEELLKQGMALVYPFADSREAFPALLAAEAEARDAKRGIWMHPYWRPVEAEILAASHQSASPGQGSVSEVSPERYQLVHGTVQSVARAGGNWYLNFGENYKTDFTAFIKAADYRRYFDGQRLEALEGKPVLLRGWVYRYNGPMMDITLPEQIGAAPATP